MNTIPLSKLATITLATSLLLAAPFAAYSDNKIWDGGSNTSSNWTDAENWGGSSPGADDMLFFGGNQRLNTNNDYAANTQFGGITFNAGAGSYILDGTAIRLNGNVVNNNENLQTINLTVALAGTSTRFETVGDIQVNGTIGLGAASTFLKTGTGTVILSNQFNIGGNGALVQIDEGSIQLNSSDILYRSGTGSSFLGSTKVNVNNGITFGHTATAKFIIRNLDGSGSIVLEDFRDHDAIELTLNQVSTTNYSGVFSGSGSLVIDGASTIVLKGINTHTGGTTIKNGTLNLTDGTIGSGGLTMEGGLLRLSSPGGGTTLTVSSLNGSGGTIEAYTGGRTLVVENNADDVSAFGGVLTDSPINPATRKLNLTKSGLGTLILTGNNTYTGLTTVNGGALIVNGNLASSGVVTVNSGGTLGGNGQVGSVNVKAGGHIAAGNSIGILKTSDSTFQAGAIYDFELSGADSLDGGVAGVDWDSIRITGTLNLTSLSEDAPLLINLFTLDPEGNRGVLDSWDAGQDNRWTGIITTTGGILFGAEGFNANFFAIDSSNFLSGSGQLGQFSVALSGNNLDIVYTAVPEPSATALLGALAIMGGWKCIRRYRR